MVIFNYLTIFIGGWIHIWLSCEYIQLQDDVCGIELKQITVIVFLVMDEYVTQCKT